MFRVYLGSIKSSPFRCSIISRHLRFQPFHCNLYRNAFVKSISSNTAPAEELPLEEAKPKRGPGRPKKNSSPSEETKPKRGPGRPKKNSSPSEETKPTRGPGRPKKTSSPSAEPVTDDTIETPTNAKEIRKARRTTTGSKKSTESEAVNTPEQIIEEIQPKRRLRKSVSPELEENGENAAADTKETKPKRRSRKTTPASGEQDDENTAADTDTKLKRRSRKSVSSRAEENDENISPYTEEIKPKRRSRKSTSSSGEKGNENYAADGEEGTPKRRSRKLISSSGEEDKVNVAADEEYVKPKRGSRKSTSLEVKQDKEHTIASGEEEITLKRPSRKPISEREQDKEHTDANENVEPKRKLGRPYMYKQPEIAEIDLIFSDATTESKILSKDYDSKIRKSESTRSPLVPKLKAIPENDNLPAMPMPKPEIILPQVSPKVQEIQSGSQLDPGMLRHLSKGYRLGSKQGDRTRVNIVSELLCDDVLDRLKPTLTKHIGCDVIDINPGVSIWSSKLHNILKPRTHILMEPDAQKYTQWQQPLLDAPNSTYKLIPKSGTVWKHLEQAMSSEFLPHQIKLPAGDPKLNQPNNTLLLVANLTHFPKKTFRGFQSMSVLVLYQLLAAARSHALAHQYGLVRMLVWIPDDEKLGLLPRHCTNYRKATVEAHVTCESIKEIASSGINPTRYVQDSELVVQNTLQVLERMRSNGITNPEHRQGPEEIQARKILDGGGSVGNSHRWLRTYSDEFVELQRRFDEGTLQKHYPYDDSDPSVIPERTTEWKRLIALRGKLEITKNQAKKYDQLLDELTSINKLHNKLKSLDPSSEEAKIATEELRTKEKAWEEMHDFWSGPMQKQVYLRFDSRNINGPHKRREVEPLKTYPEEVWPNCGTALLDLQPKALWPCLQEKFPQNYDVFEYILGSMFESPSQTVHEAFKALAPGALEVLSAECPSLFDHEKGGCWSLKYMTVRSLTLEMLKEIIEAWLKWPFAPSRFDLMSRSGSDVFDEARDDVFDSVEGV